METARIRNVDGVPPKIAAEAARRLQEALGKSDSRPALAPREAEIVDLAEQGFSNREIGERMGTTRGTVSNRLVTIYLKFGLKSREELAFCVRGGMIIRDGRIVGGWQRPVRLTSLPVE